MEILIILAAAGLLVWALAAWKLQLDSKANLLPTVGALVVIVGSVLGYDFFHLSGGPIPITLDRLLLIGLWGLLIIFWLRGNENIRSLNLADGLILILIGVLTISTLAHDWRFMERMPASRLIFFYFMPVALYAVVRTVKLNATDLKWISLLFAGLGVYLAVTAVAETREMTSWIFPRYIMNAAEVEFLGRGRGPFLNPVSNGIFQCICLCAMWMWWPTASQRGKLILIALTGVMVVGIFSTLTRSVWLGLIVSGGLFVWLPASRPIKGGLIMLATLVLIVSWPVVGEKVFSFKRDKEVSQAEMEQSAQLRPMFVIVAWDMFQDRPLLGCGFGQYAREKYPYLQGSESGKPLSATKYFMQHNVFLAYLTELGLLGLSLLLAMLAVMTSVGWRVWNNRQLNRWARMYGLLMLVLLANYAINGMFHDVSIVPMQNMLQFFLFGIVNNIVSKPDEFLLVKPDEQLEEVEKVETKRAEPLVPQRREKLPTCSSPQMPSTEGDDVYSEQ